MAEFAHKDALKALARETRMRVGSLVVLISEILPSHEQVLAKSGVSFPPPLTDIIPLDYSICQHVVGMNYLLVMEDALTHPLMLGNRSVEEFGVSSYIGAPIYADGDKPFGALCALDLRKRRWSEDEIETIKQAAAQATKILRA